MTTQKIAIEYIKSATKFNGVDVPVAIQMWTLMDLAWEVLMMSEALTFDEYCEVIEAIDENVSSEFGTSDSEVHERIRNVIDNRKGINVMLSYFVSGNIRTPTMPYCCACRQEITEASRINGNRMDITLVNTTKSLCYICTQNKGE